MVAVCVVWVWDGTLGWQRQRQVKTRGETGRETSAASSQQSAGSRRQRRGQGALTQGSRLCGFRDWGGAFSPDCDWQSMAPAPAACRCRLLTAQFQIPAPFQLASDVKKGTILFCCTPGVRVLLCRICLFAICFFCAFPALLLLRTCWLLLCWFGVAVACGYGPVPFLKVPSSLFCFAHAHALPAFFRRPFLDYRVLPASVYPSQYSLHLFRCLSSHSLVCLKYMKFPFFTQAFSRILRTIRWPVEAHRTAAVLSRFATQHIGIGKLHFAPRL